MIVVKIELHSARNRKVSELGRMHICNDGKRTIENPKRGTYNVTLFKRGSDKILRTGVIEDWPRFSYSIWKLLAASIGIIYPNPKSKIEDLLAGCDKEENSTSDILTEEDYRIMASDEYD